MLNLNKKKSVATHLGMSFISKEVILRVPSPIYRFFGIFEVTDIC